MNIETTVIDAGGRYGLPSSWKSFLGELRYYLFEPDFAECERLKTKYLRRSDEIFALNNALDEKDGVLEIDMFMNRAIISSAVRKSVSLLFKDERLREAEIVEGLEVKSRSIASFVSKTRYKLTSLN